VVKFNYGVDNCQRKSRAKIVNIKISYKIYDEKATDLFFVDTMYLLTYLLTDTAGSAGVRRNLYTVYFRFCK